MLQTDITASLRRADLPRDQLVTSSDLVRQFGKWQERAARQPVYVLHRGRPRFVLTSVELMEALCAPLSGEAADEALRLTALLDGTNEIVLVADAERRIVATSRAARSHFGALAAAGARIDGIAADTTQPLLAAALARVAASGTGDQIELPSAARPDRQLSLALLPYRGGVVLLGSDESVASELRTVRAEASAAAEALATNPGAAHARINLRGYLDQPGADLAALTGVPGDALANIRFVSLIEIAGRVAVGDAIEAVIADGKPRGLDATLLVNRKAPLAVRIGLAARRPSLAVEGVHALLVASLGGLRQA